MSVTLLIVGYVLSIPLATYVACRVAGDTWPAPFAVAWPIFYPMFLIVAALIWIAERAEEHSA